MTIKINKYTLAAAAACLVIYLVRRKWIDHRKTRLQQRFIEDFKYQRRKPNKDHYGEYTL